MYVNPDIKIGDEVVIISLNKVGVIANTFFATESDLNYQVIFDSRVEYFSGRNLRKHIPEKS